MMKRPAIPAQVLSRTGTERQASSSLVLGASIAIMGVLLFRMRRGGKPSSAAGQRAASQVAGPSKRAGNVRRSTNNKKRSKEEKAAEKAEKSKGKKSSGPAKGISDGKETVLYTNHTSWAPKDGINQVAPMKKLGA